MKILVVDYEAYIRKFLNTELSRIGFNVISAYDKNNAIGIIQREDFVDIAILELAIPSVEDGFKLIEYIKQESPLTKIIVLTDNATPLNKGKAVQLGVCDFISKPNKKPDIKPDNFTDLIESTKQAISKITLNNTGG